MHSMAKNTVIFLPNPNLDIQSYIFPHSPISQVTGNTDGKWNDFSIPCSDLTKDKFLGESIFIST